MMIVTKFPTFLLRSSHSGRKFIEGQAPLASFDWGSETTQLHRAARRRGGRVAACGARAAGRAAADQRTHDLRGGRSGRASPPPGVRAGAGAIGLDAAAFARELPRPAPCEDGLEAVPPAAPRRCPLVRRGCGRLSIANTQLMRVNFSIL